MPPLTPLFSAPEYLSSIDWLGEGRREKITNLFAQLHPEEVQRLEPDYQGQGPRRRPDRHCQGRR